MYLKKLHLQGFKTFADKTQIDFAPGVTAVVGPNGSGKSNIADAILWVLGEQKASALRGSTSKDVIFSGSDKRRPMGMAEVSLTVDNSDHTLPVEFDEVTITRRAYRTGEGEYFINKVPCRLKDIYELFLDTGVGREAYSLVNQSEIDAVLSVNPEDRRGLFEEAAGIKKYRVKKREALRKLENTENNLTRVHDILSEIEGRIEPLRIEAERASQYIKLRNRLRDIETNLLIIDLRFTDAELNAIRKAKTDEQSKVEEQNDVIDKARAYAAEMSEQLAQAEQDLEAWRETYQKAMSEAERAESQRALAAQRVSGLEVSLGLLAQEIESLASRRERLVGEIAQLQSELNAAQGSEKELTGSVDGRLTHLKDLNDRINEMTRRSERRRTEAMNLARQHAARQSDLSRAEARVAELETSLPSLHEEAERLRVHSEQAAKDAEAAKNAVATTREQLAVSETAVQEARAAYDQARQDLHNLQQERHSIHSKTVSLSSRLRALQDLEDAQEGYYAGVKAVTEASRRGKLRGEFTVVADAFKAPDGYEVAFETALGGSVQDIITDTESDAKAAIQFLYDSRLGRATFLPLDRMRGNRDSLDLGRAATMRGVLGGALDLIQFDQKFRPALENLLGRVIICETLDDATEASRVARGWSRIVTLTGEVVSPSGALTGGRQQGRGAGQLLGRKNEIASLRTELKECENAEKKCDERLIQTEKKRESSEKALSEAQQQKQVAQLAANEAVRKAEFAQVEARRSVDQSEQASRRSQTADTSLSQAREQVDTAAKALEAAGMQTADVDDAINAEARELAELTAERDALQSETTTDRIQLATQSEKVSNLARSLRAAQADVELVSRQQEQKSEQSRQAQEERDTLVAQTALRDAECERASTARDDAKAGLEKYQIIRQEAAEESKEAARILHEIEENRSVALELIHKNELRETRLDMQRNQLALRLLEEYEIDAEEVIALPEDPEVIDGSQTEVNRLRRELKQMGDVNTGSVEEYEEVSQRYEFLTTQRADLDESREKLLAAIKDIDDSTRTVFMDTFHAVAKAFDEMFTRLFRGGKTDLVLTNPDDLLETGIDIMVQPPGKKRQNLQLLSGGERALTAAALLFAFLKIKPSPFCVMDEVDAPLDGANVERFADILAEFGQKSQFIIITHNPTTMEAAPVWYGVTMQEPGISRVLSMQAPLGPDAQAKEEPVKGVTITPLIKERADKNGNGHKHDDAVIAG